MFTTFHPILTSKDSDPHARIIYTRKWEMKTYTMQTKDYEKKDWSLKSHENRESYRDILVKDLERVPNVTRSLGKTPLICLRAIGIKGSVT